jgi:superfamily II DNA or RNA helicase
LGEGVDVPSISATILLRPTRSLTVHLQQIGRGLRPAPGKECLVVIDVAGNSLTHGLADEEHRWSLEAAPKRAPPNLIVDEETGAVGRAPLIVDATAEMVELTRDRRLARLCRLPYRRFLAERRSRQELEAYRVAHGYQPGWTWHVQRQQAGR